MNNLARTGKPLQKIQMLIRKFVAWQFSEPDTDPGLPMMTLYLNQSSEHQQDNSVHQTIMVHYGANCTSTMVEGKQKGHSDPTGQAVLTTLGKQYQ